MLKIDDKKNNKNSTELAHETSLCKEGIKFVEETNYTGEYLQII